MDVSEYIRSDSNRINMNKQFDSGSEYFIFVAIAQVSRKPMKHEVTFGSTDRNQKQNLSSDSVLCSNKLLKSNSEKLEANI